MVDTHRIKVDDNNTEWECGNCGFTYTQIEEADKCCMRADNNRSEHKAQS